MTYSEPYEAQAVPGGGFCVGLRATVHQVHENKEAVVGPNYPRHFHVELEGCIAESEVVVGYCIVAD